MVVCCWQFVRKAHRVASCWCSAPATLGPRDPRPRRRGLRPPTPQTSSGTRPANRSLLSHPVGLTSDFRALPSYTNPHNIANSQLNAYIISWTLYMSTPSPNTRSFGNAPLSRRSSPTFLKIEVSVWVCAKITSHMLSNFSCIACRDRKVRRHFLLCHAELPKSMVLICLDSHDAVATSRNVYDAKALMRIARIQQDRSGNRREKMERP